MEKSERQASDGGRARDRHMMGKSKRQANDGEEQETDMQMIEKSERQAGE